VKGKPYTMSRRDWGKDDPTPYRFLYFCLKGIPYTMMQDVEFRHSRIPGETKAIYQSVK